jgi:release factor glutamine methyltransferase
LLDWTTQFFQKKGSSEARLDAQLLLAHVLGCSKVALYTRYTEEPTESQRAQFRELVQHRVNGCPVAYLLGTREFFSLDFEVNPAVLVPRGDSGYLVSECLALARQQSGPRILDVGTGSGCLAIAIAKHQKDAILTASDISAAALTVARRNADKHQLSERIRFLEGDLFAPVPTGEPFDFIVSNPPYIRTDVWLTIAPQVRDHEPRLALDGGPDGFAILDRLIAEAPGYLVSGGYLLVEIGYDQETEARNRFERQGCWEAVKTTIDGAGHPRVLRARLAGRPRNE